MPKQKFDAPAGAAAGAVHIGPLAPRILRYTPEGSGADWQGTMSRAVSNGFDTILWHGSVPGSARQDARDAGLAFFADVHLFRAEGDVPEGLFAALPEPTLDPRRETRLSDRRVPVLTGDASVRALAQFWAGRVAGADAPDGVRLLGLGEIPAAHLDLFLSEFRSAAPGVTLFGWTAGLPWPTLRSLGRGALDLLSLSLPWWDGRGDWIWRELDLLRSLGAVVADAGESASLAHRRLAVVFSLVWVKKF